MGLGLGMDQIQTIGKEVFDYAREIGGRRGGGRNLRLDSRTVAIHLARGGVGRGPSLFPAYTRSRLAQGG